MSSKAARRPAKAARIRKRIAPNRAPTPVAAANQHLARDGTLWRDAGQVSRQLPLAPDRPHPEAARGGQRIAGWTGAGIAAVVALWLSALGLGVVGTVAAGNDDPSSWAVFSSYAIALLAVVTVTGIRGHRRHRPLRVIVRGAAVAVLIAQIPAVPIIVAAMSM